MPKWERCVKRGGLKHSACVAFWDEGGVRKIEDSVRIIEIAGLWRMTYSVCNVVKYLGE
mgnify:CR=1 FL=1